MAHCGRKESGTKWGSKWGNEKFFVHHETGKKKPLSTPTLEQLFARNTRINKVFSVPHETDIRKHNNNIFLIPEKPGKGKYYNLGELPDEYHELFCEQTKNVWIYKTPLSKLQQTNPNHRIFVVFQTESYYWSVEKDGDGIVIQIFKSEFDVRYYTSLGHKINVNATEITNGLGTKTVNRLMNYLTYNDVNKVYDFIKLNFQHYASIFFNLVTKYRGENDIETKSDLRRKYPIFFVHHETGKGTQYLLVQLPDKYRDIFSEQILNVWIYKTSLSKWNLTYRNHHIFVVFQTKSYYWSMEEDGDGIAIQIFKSKSEVKDYKSDGQRRNYNVTEIESGRGIKTVDELMDYLIDHVINQAMNYRSLNLNFKDFASMFIAEGTTIHCEENKSNYKYNIFFVLQKTGKGKYFNCENLPFKYRQLHSEQIQNVWVYRTPLSNLQQNCFKFHRRFVVFQTKSYYWSVEKDGDGIVIQIFESESEVRDYTPRGHQRHKTVRAMESGRGKRTVDEVMDYLKYYVTNYLTPLFFNFITKGTMERGGTKDIGTKWDLTCQYPIFFVHHETGKGKYVNLEEFPDKYCEIFTERIENVWVYNTKLTECQQNDSTLNHKFVVFQTGSYYWSVEEDGVGNVIQIFKSISEVRDYSPDGHKRYDVTQMAYGRGVVIVDELMDYLIDCVINNAYRSIDLTFQRYASTVFNFIIKGKVNHCGNKEIATKWGSTWKYKIFFALQEPGKGKHFNLEELPSKYCNLLSEQIHNVLLYKTPLAKFQLTDFILHHRFVVFQTKSYYWSVEKDGEGIVIQIFESESEVRDYTSNGIKRNKSATQMASGIGTKTVGELIDFLLDNEVNLSYNFIQSNCQHFASRIFEFNTKNTNQIQVFTRPH